jgi:hypothetical protein
MLDKLRENAALAALIVAVVALFVALGGIAGALPGKKTVDKNDLKKNTVASKNVINDGLTGTDIKESTLNLPADALPSISYQNSGPIQYGKDGFGVVHLRGPASGIPIGGTITTLPTGFRPPTTQDFAAIGLFSSPCEVEVGTDGAVKLFGTASCQTGLIEVNGVTFSAA